MADKRPDIPEGFLGPTKTFAELELATLSHPKPEFTARDNRLEIKIQAKSKVKFSHHLINCRTDKDVSECVFGQMREGVIHYIVHLPETDYYKLKLYACPVSEPSDSLPNVYNYLIRCTRANQKVFPFPDRFAHWKEGCYLYEPLVLHPNSNLTDINWRVNIPYTKAVAVLVNDDWHHFERKGGPQWQAKFSLDKWRGQNAKVILTAKYEAAEDGDYITLLEYQI